MVLQNIYLHGLNVTKVKSVKEVSEQISTVGVLVFVAVGVVAFLLILITSLSHVTAQQTATTNTTSATTTATEGISEIPDLPPQTLVTDNEPFYQTTSSNITSMRIVDVSPSVVVQEVSFIGKAFMRDIGNVTNIGTFTDNISHDGTRVHGAGKGIITIEGGGDMISWNSYDLGLTVYGNDTADGNDRKTITTYRGIVFFNTNSERLSFLNDVVGLYITWVIDGQGSGLGQIWEWKNNNY